MAEIIRTILAPDCTMTPPDGHQFRFTLRTLFAVVTGIAVAMAIVRIAGCATIPYAVSVAFNAVGVYFVFKVGGSPQEE